jgi:hypothetical protein
VFCVELGNIFGLCGMMGAQKRSKTHRKFAQMRGKITKMRTILQKLTGFLPFLILTFC